MVLGFVSIDLYLLPYFSVLEIDLNNSRETKNGNKINLTSRSVYLSNKNDRSSNKFYPLRKEISQQTKFYVTISRSFYIRVSGVCKQKQCECPFGNTFQ